MAAGMAFYLVGSVVGLFSEVYTRSRRLRGVSDDSGIEFVRLLTIPQLSGIAGVLGVVLTRLGGTATSSGTPTLADIFSLAAYPFGIVIAAIFGLTPGLLLARLRQQTDEYKEELARTGTGAEKPAESWRSRVARAIYDGGPLLRRWRSRAAAPAPRRGRPDRRTLPCARPRAGRAGR